MQLKGNTILITGGSSGIGLGFALEFLRSGNKVIICGRRSDKLKQIQEEHPEIAIYTCDISNAESREDLFSQVTKNYPEINVLINNAGIQLGTNITHQVDLKKVQQEIETNVVAPIHLSSLFIGHLKTKKEAAIINITSGLAFTPLAFMPVYCATKAAMHSLTLSLRHNLKHTSIKVFEIAPPSVDTELGHDRREDKSQSHGGIPVADFLKEAMEAISGDIFEAAIGQAKGLRQKREELFNIMNN